MLHKKSHQTILKFLYHYSFRFIQPPTLWKTAIEDYTNWTSTMKRRSIHIEICSFRMMWHDNNLSPIYFKFFSPNNSSLSITSCIYDWIMITIFGSKKIARSGIFSVYCWRIELHTKIIAKSCQHYVYCRRMSIVPLIIFPFHVIAHTTLWKWHFVIHILSLGIKKMSD